MKESSNKKFNDQCLGFSYNYAYGLYANDRSINSSTIRNGTSYGKNFKRYTTSNESEFLTKVYNEITAGKPVVIQVNGNSQGTCRHFVTVVGYKAGITSASQLTEKDLLIVDSWDGQLERMDTSSSRFLTTGAACHKNYSGYYLRVKR